MRRLPRILLNAATAASLVLCVTVAMLWARSYRVADTLSDWARDDSRWTEVVSNWGCVELWNLRTTGLRLGERPRFLPERADQCPDPFRRWEDDLGLDPCWRIGRLGFARADSRPPTAPLPFGTTTLGGWLLVVPDWLLVVTFGAMPFAAFARHLRGPRKPGFCPTCDYDLRATPARCPECGTIPAR
jgi:hypothetical protein